jgi:glutathione S-transferase
MKLYNMNLSNFSTKCRITVYEKGCPVEIAPIPGGEPFPGVRRVSAEYQKIYRMGKIPALEVDGQVFGESEVINEYLEEKFPSPSLLPGTPEQRAKVRTFSRFHDLYLDPPLRALIAQANPKTRDQEVVSEKLPELMTRFEQLEQMLAERGFAAAPDFTFADCALAPTTFIALNVLPAFGMNSVVENHPKLSRWWSHVQARPSVKKALSEMAEALATFQTRRR